MKYEYWNIEISFVSRTKNRLIMTRDLIDTIKTDRRIVGDCDTENFLPAVQIKKASVYLELKSRSILTDKFHFEGDGYITLKLDYISK